MTFEAELTRHYREVRKRLRAAQLPPPRPVVVPEKPAPAPEVEPPISRHPGDRLPWRVELQKRIFEIVQRETGIDRQSLKSAERRKEFVAARRLFCWLAVRCNATISRPGIGRLLGNRDHSTVYHHMEKAARMRLVDPEYAALLDRLEQEVRGS